MIEDETQSMLSPHNSQLTIGSQQTTGGLLIPSNSSIVGNGVGGVDFFGEEGGSSRVARMGPPQQLEDDLGLIIEPDGTMRMSEAPAREARGPIDRADRTTPISALLGGTLQHSEAMVCSLQFSSSLLQSTDEV